MGCCCFLKVIYLFYNRARYDVGYQGAEAYYAAFVGGVDCVGEQDHGRVGVGVYYKGGACIAGMAVGVGAEQIAGIGGIG